MPQFGRDSTDGPRDRRDDHEQPVRPSSPPADRPATTGEHQKPASQFATSDQSELVIDPALRSNTPRLSAVDPEKKGQRDEQPRTQSPANISMPLRAVEPSSFMSSSHRRQHFSDDTHRLPSPPASIPAIPPSHSPSPSVASADRSSISTPPIRRSPPQTSMPPPTHLFQSSYHHDPSMIQSSQRHHSQQQQEHFARADHMSHGPYIYAPPPPFDHRYDHSHPVNHSPYTASGIPSHFSVPPPMAHHPPPTYGHPYPQPGPQQPVTIMHTDDAATKLSDRVRRRCFNCCTTDTSTWRRSNLSPGKVLCNKCGLFERTHSRPRPEQFPHKRGPLATTSLQRRTPPAGGAPSASSGGSISSGPPPPPPHGHGPPPQGYAQHLPPIGGPPYQYAPHPSSIPPLSSSGSAASQGGRDSNLPTLQSWHSNPPPQHSSSSSAPANGDGQSGTPPHSRRQSESAGGANNGGQRPPTPPSRSGNASQESGVRENGSAARDAA